MFERKPRCHIVVHTTPHFVRVARLDADENELTRLAAPAEFEAAEADAKLAQWIEREAPEGPGFIAGYCGFHPPSGLLIREELALRAPANPDLLLPLIQRRARTQPDDGWSIGLVEGLAGTSLATATGQQVALIVALGRHEIRQYQRHLVKLGIRPRRLEFAPLAGLGAISRHFQSTLADSAIAVCEFGLRDTQLYFLDRKGVHPQTPLPFGLQTIEESAQMELNLDSPEATRAALDAPDEATLKRAPRLLRLYARHLRLTLDYFEHQTGRVVTTLFPVNLPTLRHWLAPALARAVDLSVPEVDVVAWAAGHRLDATTLPDAALGWLPTLALIGESVVATPAAAPTTDAPAA